MHGKAKTKFFSLPNLRLLMYHSPVGNLSIEHCILSNHVVYGCLLTDWRTRLTILVRNDTIDRSSIARHTYLPMEEDSRGEINVCQFPQLCNSSTDRLAA